MSLVNAASLTHDIYVGTYEVLAEASSFLWDRLPAPFPNLQVTARRSIHNGVTTVCTGVCSGFSQIIQRTNSALGYPRNQTVLRDFRGEMKELSSRAKQETYALSAACSYAFDRTILLTSTPTVEEVQQITDKLYQFIETPPAGTSNAQLAEARVGVATCFRLIEVHQEIIELRDQDISPDDFRAFQESISRNQLLGVTIDATVENIGEMLGGQVIDESGGILPTDWNPAVALGRRVCDHIARPLGRTAGGVLSLTGIYYLLENLPLMSFENHRKKIQAAAILLTLAAEYYQMNPVSNFVQEQAGEHGYDFAFYSVALLFNYLGMYMAGTNESLGSYVRNMTPSMIVYKAVYAALEFSHIGDFTNLMISFYLSHVAYNFDIYSKFSQGLLGRDYDMGAVGEGLNGQEMEAVRSARTQLTAMLMQNLANRIQAVEQPIQAHQETIQAISHNVFSEGQEETIAAWLGTFRHSLTEGREFLAGEGEHFAVLNEALQNGEEAIFRLREEYLLDEKGLVIREFNEFCRILDTDLVRGLIDRYKRQLVTVMEQTEIQNIDAPIGRSRELEEIRTRIIEELLSDYYDGERRRDLIEGIKPFLDSYLTIEHAKLGSQVEDRANSYMASLYPLIPSPSREEELCSVHMMDMLIKSFAIFSMLRIGSGRVDLVESGAPLERRNYLELLSNISNLTFHTRYPTHLSGASNVRRGMCRDIVNAQFREV